LLFALHFRALRPSGAGWMDSLAQVRYTEPNTDGFDKGTMPAPDAKQGNMI